MNEEQLNEQMMPQEGQPVEVEKTAEVDTPKGRAALRSRYAQRFPDRNWDDEDDDALADQAIADYDEMDGRLKKHEENDRKLEELFDKDPQAASFLMGMAKGEDFLTNLQKNFGEDIVEAMQNPEKLEDLKKANQEYIDKVSKNKELQANWEANMEGTLERLQQEQDANGLSDDEVQAGMDDLEKVVNEYLEGNISSETIKMFLKAANHDKDVEVARRDGEINGRNAHIEEKMKKRANETDGMPQLGGQSTNARGMAFKRGQRDENTGSGIWAAGNFRRNNY